MNLDLNEKIKGCLVGYAIGDALGKGTEFMTAREASARYPGGLRHYEKIIRDAHRSQWDRNDITLDTEIILRLIDCFTNAGEASPTEFAKALIEWQESMPYELDSHFLLIIRQPDFATDPIGVSRRLAQSRGNNEARNEALGRAMLIGTKKDDYQRKIIENCRTTHYDSRCVSSAVVIGEMAHQLIWHDKTADPDSLIALASEIDERTVPYITAAHEGNLEDLQLDDRSTYWYARKTMAAALWALWHTNSPEEALYALVDAGGDADTNASLATGLMGLRHGYRALPSHLADNLLQIDRITNSAETWSKFLSSL